MDEIKEALSILKARWLEAVLIIGLTALPAPLINLLSTVYIPKNMSWMKFINMGTFLIYITLSLFALLIRGGFLRTVYLEGKKRQTVPSLIKTGRHFFSRLLSLGLLYIGAMILPIVILSLIAQTKHSGGIFQAKFISFRIIQPIVRLILAKPILLVPAMIVVLDCELFKSFGLMRRIRLLDAKPMLAVFLVQLVLWLFFPNLPQGSLWQYPVSILYQIVLHGLSLSIGIMAVRFVSSASRNYQPCDMSGG